MKAQLIVGPPKSKGGRIELAAPGGRVRRLRALGPDGKPDQSAFVDGEEAERYLREMPLDFAPLDPEGAKVHEAAVARLDAARSRVESQRRASRAHVADALARIEVVEEANVDLRRQVAEQGKMLATLLDKQDRGGPNKAR